MIPTLDEVIEVCRTSNMKLIVHLVHSNYYQSLDVVSMNISSQRTVNILYPIILILSVIDDAQNFGFFRKEYIST